MSTQRTQTTLVGDPTDEAVTIATDGRVIRGALAPLAALVDECRVHVDADGLHVAAVDGANVGSVALDVAPAAFEEYTVDADTDDGLVLGWDLDTLTTILSDARKGVRTRDPVEIVADRTHVYTTTRREYGTTGVERSAAVMALDPNSIRQDSPVPDLSFDWRVTLDTRAFVDAIAHADASSEHLVVTEADGEMRWLGERLGDDDRDRTVHNTAVAFDADVEPARDDPPAGARSVYSLDYLVDMAGGIDDAYADAVTVAWGDAYPLEVSFVRTDDDGETLYSGRYRLAPRITNDDDVPGVRP